MSFMYLFCIRPLDILIPISKMHFEMDPSLKNDLFDILKEETKRAFAWTKTF